MIRKITQYFIFSLLLSCGHAAFSQAILTGKITDGTTGERLAGATITIKTPAKTATSDVKGIYVFTNLPLGKYSLNVSFVGYRDTFVSVNITGTSASLNIQMTNGAVTMESVVITATRTEKYVKDIPASVGIITQDQIQNLPAISADEYLSAISGVNITRHYGIFYKTGDVTMRGLNRNVHTLLLIDGVPISILDGGATNWNRIKPEDIARIEVVKGPNSSLYGSNAMGGVINIITKTPARPFSGSVEAFYGTYATSGGSLDLKANNVKNGKGFYWNVDGFMRESNGYILEPDSLRDSTDIKTYSREYNGNFLLGYAFNKKQKLELEYSYSDDTKGQGVKIYESNGNYDHTVDHFLQGRYKASFGKVNVSAIAFFKLEDYDNQKESIKSSGAYILYNTATNSGDGGLWCNASVPLAKKHLLTFGFDSKLGATNSSDVYHTSTDTVSNKGIMNFYGLFVQDDFPVIKDRIKAIIGLRYDNVLFYNGDISIKEPSATTAFMTPYLKSYDTKNWQALSPKAGILFDISKSLSSYISYSQGFRSSTVSDLVLTADVNKGFKIANPLLKPEYLNSLELGFSWDHKNKLTVEPDIFYSIGKDFQYFVGTGDSIYTNKTKKEPIIERQNIGKVEIYGAEIAVNYDMNKYLTLFGNYAYNYSVIKSFDVVGFVAQDLTGKYIIDVSPHQAYAGFIFKSRIANLSMICKYKGPTWADDQNTQQVKGYSLVNAKISRKIVDKVNLSVTVENLFNTIYLDSK